MFHHRIGLVIFCLIEPQSTVVPCNSLLFKLALTSHISYHRAIIQINRPYKCAKMTISYMKWSEDVQDLPSQALGISEFKLSFHRLTVIVRHL